MKSWGILIGGLILGIACAGFAQTDMNSLFSGENKNIIYSGEAKEYTGSPLVFIEGISDQPKPKNWRDELKIKLFGSMEIPQKEAQKPLPPLQQTNVQDSITINTLFGKEKEVAFVPHTADWNFIIQILNDEDISVQEEIQFIKTADVPDLIRDWPKQNLTLMSAQINGQEIPLQIEEKSDSLQLKLPQLETGVYKLRLNYLIRKVGDFGKKKGKLAIGLTEMGWNLPSDSFNGIILFPTKINDVKTQFLLGKNHQEIEGAFENQTDEQGALFFRATHLMPAHSAIQMNLDLTFDSFVKKGIWEKIKESTSTLIFLISLGVIFLYLILNVIEIKITPLGTFPEKKNFSNNSFKNFLHRTGEIWLGLSLLWLIAFGVLYLTNNRFNSLQIQILFLIPIVFVLIMDYVLLYPRQETLRKIWRNND